MRCPPRVVEIADCLIRNNHQRYSSPRLQARSNSISGKIHIVQWKSTIGEAEGVSGYVKHLVEHNYNPSEILIITPRRILASEIQNRIKRYNIPIYSFYYEEALAKTSAQRAFALLTLLSNKEDRVALRWWLGQSSPTGRSNMYQKLREHCERSGESPRCVLEAMSQGKLNLPGASKLVGLFEEMSRETTRLSVLKLQDLVADLLPKNDDACSILRNVAERALAESENIQQLFDYIATNIFHPEVPDGNFVRIMSPQKAKGLSSKVVIVTSCIEGLFPGIRSDQSQLEQEEHIREQRRLFYVAITRCKEILVLSSFTRAKRGEARRMGIPVLSNDMFWNKQIASRFISELGPTAPRAMAGTEWQASRYTEAPIQ